MDELPQSTQYNPPTSGPAPEELKAQSSGRMKKVFIFGGSGILLLIGVFIWWLFAGSGQSLAISIAVPDRMQTGIPVEVAVNMNNDSGSELKDAQVSLSLPDGVIFVGVPGRRTVENQRIGALPEHKLTKTVFTIMATGIQNTIVELKAEVSYVPGALSSRFAKSATTKVVIGEPGIEVSVAPPVKVFGGEEFTTDINYRNVSTFNFDSAQLKLIYPAGFSFKSATVQPSDVNNSIWEIGSLPAGGEGILSIKGSVSGQDGENFDIRALIAAAVGEGFYDVANQVSTVGLAPAPLSIRVDVLPSREAVFSLAEQVRYRLTYTNNTQTALKDVIVQAKIIGEMFDLRTLQSSGVLRSSDNTIVWNASRVPDFTLLAPNASGVLDFLIQTKAAYPITRLGSKNYSLIVRAQIESPTVPANVAAGKTLGVSELNSKIRGSLMLAALGYYRDTQSGITNSGSLPPRVGQNTQFTIHWQLRNTSTDVESIVVRAFLGPNVRYTGAFKSNVASSTPEYNDRTQEMIWRVPKMQATQGVLSDPAELTFQVELAPSATQIGTYPELVKAPTVEYQDLFTGEKLNSSAKEITTRLPDDLSIANLERSVKE